MNARAKDPQDARFEFWRSINGGPGKNGQKPVTNINGKAYAMNAITPMKPWKTPLLRLFFFLLGAIKPLQTDLKNLSFIHFARWVIVGRNQFPHLSDKQPREELRYDYLIFFSNFNGTWNQYIDAFSAVLSRGLNFIWRWSEKFPGSAYLDSQIVTYSVNKNESLSLAATPEASF